MRSAKGRKRAKRKIGEHLVLNLEVKMRHAIGEGPKKGQTKNSRASCTQFRGQNEACGRRRAEKGAKIKIRDNRLLILGVKVRHAVGEGPKKGQTKNWR